MAWITYTGGTAGAARLAAFKTANPNAAVVMNKTDTTRAVADVKQGNHFVKVVVTEHQTITEYRALTQATAEHLMASLATNDRKRLEISVTHNGGVVLTANCPNLLGTERQCVMSRANDADGYMVTVTETTANWGTAVGGEVVIHSLTGAGTGTSGDVRFSWS